MVAFSSPGFFSSNTASGRPLTNTTTSGRRSFFAPLDRELVDRQQVVALERVGPVDQPRPDIAQHAFGVAVLDRHALDQQLVRPPVLRLDHRRLGTQRRLDGLLDSIVGQVRVQLDDRVPEASIEHHLAVVGALCTRHSRRDVRPVQRLPTLLGQHLQNPGPPLRLRDSHRSGPPPPPRAPAPCPTSAAEAVRHAGGELSSPPAEILAGLARTSASRRASTPHRPKSGRAEGRRASPPPHREHRLTRRGPPRGRRSLEPHTSHRTPSDHRSIARRGAAVPKKVSVHPSRRCDSRGSHRPRLREDRLASR